MFDGLELNDLAIEIPSKGIKRFSGRLASGECLIVQGPSGCGKTTLLRTIAGLAPSVAGEIFLRGQKITQMPTSKRKIGFVFQSSALLPHLNVLENVCFGLDFAEHSKDWSKDLKKRRGTEFLEQLGISTLSLRSVKDLSGGEKQRVALARALIWKPNLVLLDEPLSAVDVSRRKELRQWIERFVIDHQNPLVFVTHDQEEARDLGTRTLLWEEDKECILF